MMHHYQALYLYAQQHLQPLQQIPLSESPFRFTKCFKLGQRIFFFPLCPQKLRPCTTESPAQAYSFSFVWEYILYCLFLQSWGVRDSVRSGISRTLWDLTNCVTRGLHMQPLDLPCIPFKGLFEILLFCWNWKLFTESIVDKDKI